MSLLVVLNAGFTWISQLNGPPLYGAGFAAALLCAPPLGARRLAWQLWRAGIRPYIGQPAAGRGRRRVAIAPPRPSPLAARTDK